MFYWRWLMSFLPTTKNFTKWIMTDDHDTFSTMTLTDKFDSFGTKLSWISLKRHFLMLVILKSTNNFHRTRYLCIELSVSFDISTLLNVRGLVEKLHLTPRNFHLCVVSNVKIVEKLENYVNSSQKWDVKMLKMIYVFNFKLKWSLVNLGA